MRRHLDTLAYHRRSAFESNLDKTHRLGYIYLMPTVLRAKGFHIRIYNPPREHGPAHVHVRKGGAEVIILLTDGSQTQAVRENDGMRPADVVAAFRVVEEHAEYLLAKWREIHHDETVE
jgi:hypothetical protein